MAKNSVRNRRNRRNRNTRNKNNQTTPQAENQTTLKSEPEVKTEPSPHTKDEIYEIENPNEDVKIDPEIEKVKAEKERKAALREKLKKEKLEEEKIFYDSRWYNKDGFVDRYLKGRKKQQKIRNKEFLVEKRDNQKKVNKFDELKKRFEDSNFEESGQFSEENVENFMNDPLNQLDYEEAKIKANSNGGTSLQEERELVRIQNEREKETLSRRRDEKEFAKEYLDSHIKASEFEKNNPGFNEDTAGFEDYTFDKNFIDKNEEKFNGVNKSLQDELFKEANDKLELEETNKIFAEKESALKNRLDGNKKELRDVNQEIKKMKKNKGKFAPEDYEGQAQEILKMEELLDKKKEIKSNLKESKKEYMSRNDSRLYENEVNKLNKEAKVLDNVELLNKAETSVKAGDMKQEVFDELKTDLFGDSEIVMPKRTKAQIEEEIEKNMKLVKKFNGTVRDVEEDIVDVFKGKLKNANKFNMAFAGFSAISQYKSSRKEGRGVVSSVARAGIDFGLSEALGGPAYFGLMIAKELPGAAIKGTELLHKEVRNMNTSSRFSVFGQAQFQDTQQLATMRQSGMEMAKMANYRLEQTLMGNEAKYLHK